MDTPPSLMMAGISPFYSPSPDKIKISPLAKKVNVISMCGSGSVRILTNSPDPDSKY